MECNLEGSRNNNELAHLLYIHGAVFGQNPHHYAIDLSGFGFSDVPPHHFELLLGVNESSAPRTNDNENVNVHRGPNCADKAGTGSDASFTQRTTQLDAFCTAFCC